MSDWNDLKYLLHVYREGSTLAASRVLKLSQSTVMRRIAVVEEMLGFQLFEKSRSGYEPTAALERLLPSLVALEDAHLAFDREAALAGRNLSGTVRVTAAALLVSHLLSRPLMEFRRQHPDIKIELITSDHFLDLANGEADVALRAGDRPTEPALFGRRILAADGWSVYCSKSYAAVHGIPKTADDIRNHDFISTVEGFFTGPLVDWIEQNIPESKIVLRQNSLLSIFNSVKSGLGVSLCPDMIALTDTDFVRCLPLACDVGKELWLLAPERHRKNRQIRTVVDFFARQLSANVQKLKQEHGID